MEPPVRCNEISQYPAISKLDPSAERTDLHKVFDLRQDVLVYMLSYYKWQLFLDL